MGDFNQNVLEGSQIAQYICESFDFIQLLNSVTTDHDSCLDHIYINFSKSDFLAYGTLESYFSDHKPVYAIIYENAITLQTLKGHYHRLLKVKLSCFWKQQNITMPAT